MKLLLIFTVALFFLFGCTSEELPGKNQEKEMTINTTISTEDMPAAEETVPENTITPTDPDILSPLIAPKDEDFVRVTDYIPDVCVDLKYSTSDNFTGHIVYDFEDVFLRYGTVMKLKAVSEEFRELGLTLKIWDGFRPVSAQFKLWDICPDPTYVANPNKGFSNHSCGFAVDVTLVDIEGREVEMPTEFDDFSSLADREYSDCTATAAKNARLLESVMEKHGFSGYWGEWWHFNDTQKYEVEVCLEPGLISRRQTLDEVHLLENIWDADDFILTIPKGESVTFLGYREEYSLVEYWGYRGYIASNLIQ